MSFLAMHEHNCEGGSANPHSEAAETRINTKIAKYTFFSDFKRPEGCT